MAWRITDGRTRRWLRKRTSLGSLVGLANRDRDRLLWQAHKQLRRQKIDSAAEIYGAILMLWPGDPAARLGLAACAQLRGDLAAAEAAYSELISLDPTNAHAIANRAEVRLLTSWPSEARHDLASLHALPHRTIRRAGLAARLRALQSHVDGLPAVTEQAS